MVTHMKIRPLAVMAALAILASLAGPLGPVPLVGQGFGSSVLVGEDEILVGEPTSEREPGSVRVFRAGNWAEIQALYAPDAAVRDRFGAALAGDGSWLFVGAPGAGAVHVFERGTEWLHAARDSISRPGGVRALAGRRRRTPPRGGRGRLERTGNRRRLPARLRRWLGGGGPSRGGRRSGRVRGLRRPGGRSRARRRAVRRRGSRQCLPLSLRPGHGLGSRRATRRRWRRRWSGLRLGRRVRRRRGPGRSAGTVPGTRRHPPIREGRRWRLAAHRHRDARQPGLHRVRSRARRGRRRRVGRRAPGRRKRPRVPA